MSIFEDKVYQEMDWIEQVAEPVRFSHNDILQKLPDRYELNYHFLYEAGLSHQWGPSSVGVSEILSHLYKACGIDLKRDYKLINMIEGCFDLEMVGAPVIDLEKKMLYRGQIFLIKKVVCFEEKDVVNLMSDHASEVLNRLYRTGVPADRLNEICELLGLDEARKSRSRRFKARQITDYVINTMHDNKWNIKDIELGKRVIDWIRAYLVNNNGAAFANFCKFKVMTHYDAPIYSIENEEAI